MVTFFAQVGSGAPVSSSDDCLVDVGALSKMMESHFRSPQPFASTSAFVQHYFPSFKKRDEPGEGRRRKINNDSGGGGGGGGPPPSSDSSDESSPRRL